MADLLRRLHGPALQPAGAGDDRDGEAPDAGVDPRARHRDAAAGRPRRPDVRRRRGPRRLRHRPPAPQGGDPGGGRRAVRNGARPRLGARRARRQRAVALLLEDAGQHPHRQPRRGAVAQRALLRDARQLPGLARRAHRRGALARGDRHVRGPVLLDDGAHRGRRPRPGRHRQRPRRARLPAVVRPGDRRAPVDLPHRADDARLARARHLAEPRRGPPRRRAGVGAGRLRPGDQLLHLRHRQSDAGLHRRGAAGRQPVHLHAHRGGRRQRRDGVVLPDVAARHARLGFGADAHPHRRRDRRGAAQAGLDRGAQRLLLHRRPDQRGARRHAPLRRHGQLGQPHPADRRAAALARQGGDHPRLARLARRGRGDQLAAARLQPRHRPLLHAGEQRLQPPLPHRPRPPRLHGSRRQGARRGGLGRQRLLGHRLPHRARSSGATSGPRAAAAEPAC